MNYGHLKNLGSVTIHRRRKTAGYELCVNRLREKNLKDTTKAETAFEEILKEVGVKYVREHQINLTMNMRLKSFFLDFYLPECRIAYEIDGAIHDKRILQDADRDSAIQIDKNISIKRIKNKEVMEDRDRIIMQVKAEAIPKRLTSAT